MKFTIPAKCLHPLTVVGSFNFCIAFNLLLNGLTETLLSSINIVLSIYCSSLLNY